MSSKVVKSQYMTGRAGREGANESWATNMAGAGNANASGLTMRLQSTATTDQWQAVRRGFLSFNPLTDPFATGYIITAASLSLNIATKGTDTFAQSICLTSAIAAAPTASVAVADYQGTASSKTEYGSRVTIASMANGVRSVWTLNAAGLAYLTAQVLASGPILLGLRYSGDVDSTAPTWVSAITDDLSITTVAGALEPQLIVTYRVGPGYAVASLTGTLANTGDTVNCNLWTVEVWT